MPTVKDMIAAINAYKEINNEVTTACEGILERYSTSEGDRLVTDVELFEIYKQIIQVIQVNEQDEIYGPTCVLLNNLFNQNKEQADDVLLKALQHQNESDQIEVSSFLKIVSNPQPYCDLKQLALSKDTNQLLIKHQDGPELIDLLKQFNTAGIKLNHQDMHGFIQHKQYAKIAESLLFLQKNAPNLLLDEMNIKMILNHQRPEFVSQALSSYVNTGQTIDQNVLNRLEKDSFNQWRSDNTPSFETKRPQIPTTVFANVSPSLMKETLKVKEQDLNRSMRLLERSIADATLGYVNPNERVPSPFADEQLANQNAGPILQFANLYSARYLDLYKAYVAIQNNNNIPMIPVAAGQMKLHGFTSEDLLTMQPSCAVYSEIAKTIINTLQIEGEHYEKIINIMVGNDKDISCEGAINLPQADFEKISGISLPPDEYGKLIDLLKQYNQLPKDEVSLIKKAHFLMHDFGHLPYDKIAEQLDAVGSMKPVNAAGNDERLLMEIRHRVAGDSTIHQNSPGTLGGNPLAYLNLLTNGEPGNPEAEFRDKLYFVYMSNHFANAVVQNDKTVGEINQWLAENGKDWSMDIDFITSMRQRGAQYLPPIFRYGANAALNREFRKLKSDEEMSEYYSSNPNSSLKEIIESSAHVNATQRLNLSKREYFNQVGELSYSKNDPRNERQINYGTGAAIFNLSEKPDSSNSQATQEYLTTVNELGIPVCAGISGTLDQSTAMAGLVGLGVNEDLEKRRAELETIRLAYLAFMLPGGDHTAHEILQSSKTFGLSYVGGVGYEQYIYQADNQFLLEQLRKSQEQRGSKLPEYFYSEEYLSATLATLQAKQVANQTDLTHFNQQLIAAKSNEFPDNTPGITKDQYLIILNYFSDPKNIGLQTQLSVMDKEKTLHLPKEQTGLSHDINIIHDKQGGYNLVVNGVKKHEEQVSLTDSSVEEKKNQTHYYFIGIDLKRNVDTGQVSDSRQQLAETISASMQLSDRPDIKVKNRDLWHITIGWLEYPANEKLPIKPEDYKLIGEKIQSIIEKYQQLEFELTHFEKLSETRGKKYTPDEIRVHMEEKTGELDKIRTEIEAYVRETVPGLEFKFREPHVTVRARGDKPFTQADLPSVSTKNTFAVSNMEMMYYDDKTNSHIALNEYSTQSPMSRLTVSSADVTKKEATSSIEYKERFLGEINELKQKTEAEEENTIPRMG